MNNKMKYETPWLEVIIVDEDIITFSEGNGDIFEEITVEE